MVGRNRVLPRRFDPPASFASRRAAARAVSRRVRTIQRGREFPEFSRPANFMEFGVRAQCGPTRRMAVVLPRQHSPVCTEPTLALLPILTGPGKSEQRRLKNSFFSEDEKMTEEKTPVEVGSAPAFPPTAEPPAGGPIASAEPTTADSGPIGSANSTAQSLADVVPNPGDE